MLTGVVFNICLFFQCHVYFVLIKVNYEANFEVATRDDSFIVTDLYGLTHLPTVDVKQKLDIRMTNVAQSLGTTGLLSVSGTVLSWVV